MATITEDTKPKSDVNMVDTYHFSYRHQDGRRTEETWLVSNRLDTGPAQAVAESAKKLPQPMKLLPWGGVASRISAGYDMPPPEPLKGRAFCFLPLPVHTQYPVHVNGYFELSSNRRDIWWGQDVAGELKSSWNRVLLEEVRPSLRCDRDLPAMISLP